LEVKVKEYLKVANDPLMWIMVMPAIIIVFVQVFLFTKRAIASAHIVNMSKEEAKTALKTGFISGIGPASSVFIVMLAMTAVLGGPITWLRTVIIGAASTELAGATIGAQAMGVEFGREGYDITCFANSVLVMVLNGSGWLLICGLFTDKLDTLQHKISGGDSILLGVMGGAAMVATMSYMVSSHILAGGGRLVTAIVSGIAMIVLLKIAEKMPKLSEHTLGIAMVIGMAAGAAYVL
jgi:hypothetical protein